MVGTIARAASIAALLAALLAFSCAHADASSATAGAAACALPSARPGTRVLVYSRTTGFRHASIPAGIGAVRAIGARRGFAVDATEDPTWFTDSTLRRYSAVVFMSTTGDVLDSAQQSAFERYVRAGHGFVGVHSATDTEYDWPWYGRLVGAYFKRHPAPAQAVVDVRDRSFPATKCLPARWARTDEWYDFRAPPVDVHVLATLDESTYQGGGMGATHPIAWYHAFDGGRAFYTEMGHTEESYADPAYVDHLAGGILWAIGAAR